MVRGQSQPPTPFAPRARTFDLRRLTRAFRQQRARPGRALVAADRWGREARLLQTPGGCCLHMTASGAPGDELASAMSSASGWSSPLVFPGPEHRPARDRASPCLSSDSRRHVLPLLLSMRLDTAPPAPWATHGLLLSRACGTLNDAQFAPQETRTESPACCAPDAGFPIGGAQCGSLHAHAAGRDGTRASSWTSSGRRHCRYGVAQTAG
jgi:hypothetical protein